MLLAPLSLIPAAPVRRRASPRKSVDVAAQAQHRHWLLVIWLLLGSLAVLCMPPLRGGPATGWTLPFWLVAAPLINLVALHWSRRRR